MEIFSRTNQARKKKKERKEKNLKSYAYRVWIIDKHSWLNKKYKKTKNIYERYTKRYQI